MIYLKGERRKRRKEEILIKRERRKGEGVTTIINRGRKRVNIKRERIKEGRE